MGSSVRWETETTKRLAFLLLFVLKPSLSNIPFLFKDYKACQGLWVTQAGEADISGILSQRGDRRRGQRVHMGLQSAGAEAGGSAEEEGAAANHQEGDGTTASATRGWSLLLRFTARCLLYK